MLKISCAGWLGLSSAI